MHESVHEPGTHVSCPPCMTTCSALPDGCFQMVARLLRRAGHTVSEAKDGVVAVSMVSRTLVDRTTTEAAAAAAAAAALLEAPVDYDDAARAGNDDNSFRRVNLEPFDVILMDGNMPLMNGPDATRQIKNMGFTKVSLKPATPPPGLSLTGLHEGPWGP